MKKLFIIVLCLAAALSVFAGCTGGEAAVSPTPTATPVPTDAPTPSPTEPPFSLTMASAASLDGTPKGDALKKGFDDLKTWSNGSMLIDFFEGGDKGTDADIIASVKTGGVSIYTGDASMMAEAIPQLAVLDLPMMFTKLDACNNMLAGSFTDMMQPLFNEAGLQLLGVYAASFHNLTSNKPVAVPADFTGLRLSTSKSQYDELFWKTMGCNVMPLERSQVYIALKQGLLEAQENSDDEISFLRFYEAQTNLYKTRHGQNVGLYVMNKAQYDALTDEQKGWLLQFVSQVQGDEITAIAENESEQEAEFGKKKMTVSEPAPEVLAALKAAVQTVADAMKQNIDPALVDGYIAACQQAEGAAATPGASTPPSGSAKPTGSEQPTASAQASATP